MMTARAAGRHRHSGMGNTALTPCWRADSKADTIPFGRAAYSDLLVGKRAGSLGWKEWTARDRAFDRGSLQD